MSRGKRLAAFYAEQERKRATKTRFAIAEQHDATGVLIGVYGTYSTYEEADAACRLANDKSKNTFCVVEIQPKKEAPK